MIVGVPAEARGAERRVALVPRSLAELAKAGVEVLVQRGAGKAAGFADAEYEQKGARLAADAAELVAAADIVACVGPPGSGGNGGVRTGAGGARPGDHGTPSPGGGLEVATLRSGQVLIGLLDPFGAPEVMRGLAAAGVTSFALELLPRTTRAQSMDALSAMATVAGYKAVLLAAAALGKMFPMMITAAGTLAPARVLVIGAGVAGLQAIATARRLGAVVTGYDIRPAVKEQVESLGASFLELGLEEATAEEARGYARQMNEEFYRRQREMMAKAVAEQDVVITTAAVPGKRAPVLITADMVRGMKGASVIVDLAAETGGNCELTRPGETIAAHGVTIMGPIDLPATVPHHASQMYSKNVATFVANLVKDGRLELEGDDPIVNETMVTRGGEVVNEKVREALGEDHQSATPDRAATAPERSAD
jgi:NAD(P) transhydrogenase subunit alpha